VHAAGAATLAPSPRGLAGLVVLDGERAQLAADRTVIALLEDAAHAGVLVCAVGAGVLALEAAGLLRGGAVAADPSTADRLCALGLAPLIEPLVIHGRVATATVAGAAALGDSLHDLRGTPETAREVPT
jgi:hypothetical protein